MPSLYTVWRDAAEQHGEQHPSVLRLKAEVPAWQMALHHPEACDQRLELTVERRPGNALNIEVGTPRPRCAMKSPDGRGRAWLPSGGNALAYGPCSERCPCLTSLAT